MVSCSRTQLTLRDGTAIRVTRGCPILADDDVAAEDTWPLSDFLPDMRPFPLTASLHLHLSHAASTFTCSDGDQGLRGRHRIWDGPQDHIHTDMT